LLFFWLFIVSVLASVVAVPWVIVRLPVDYFSHHRKPQPAFSGFSPAVRIPLIIGKNLLGLALVGLGLMFLVLPGQGVIVLVIGVSLLDFPHKKQLERWLISRGPILKLANWLRAKWNRKPLQLD
jgi:hypothetical protein